MSQPATYRLAAALLAIALSGSPALAQDPKRGRSWCQEDTLRIGKEVQKKLGSLTNYSVFDWITFGIQGKTVILKGYASRPTLKDEAGRVVKGIPGIDSVHNEIEVLPLSPNDDRIRAAVYNRIYTQPALSKYNAHAGTLARAMGPRGRNQAFITAGITNNPPIAYHPIHIILTCGHLSLSTEPSSTPPTPPSPARRPTPPPDPPPPPPPPQP